MALEYVAAYYSYLDFMAELSDAECGRLFKACLTYGKTGTVPELRGNERFVWPGIKSQIDRDAEKYKTRCNQNRNNRQRSSTIVNDCERPSTKATKEKEKAKEKEKEKETYPPVSPLDDTGFSEPLQAALLSWVRYKREKRQDYKPEGLKSLIAEIRHNADKYGEDAVIALINRCMAANWQGIIFERLEKTRRDQKAAEPWHYDPGSLEGSL